MQSVIGAFTPHPLLGERKRDMSRNAHNNRNGKNGKISQTTTWTPMQVRRKEGPLVKPANLASLAKMANWSKSPTTTWRPTQMRGQEGPLEKLANLAMLWKSLSTQKLMYMNKQGDPLATWRLLSNVVAFEIIILQINVTPSLNTKLTAHSRRQCMWKTC